MSSSTIYVGGNPSELAIPQDGIVFQLTFKSAFTVPVYTDTIYNPLINSLSSYQINQYNTPIITSDTQRGNVLNLQTNGPYLSFNNVTTSTSYTFMMWIYITGYGGYSSVFAVNNNTFGFLIYNNGGIGGTNQIQILHYGNRVYTIPPIIAFNTWTHFAISFNGNINTLYNYVNGIFVSPAVTGITGISSATGTAYIGTNTTYGSQIGNYDNIRLYNRVLSADEIWLIYSIENYSTQGITNNFQGNLYYASVFNRVLTSYEISTYNAIINPQNNINATIGYNYVPPSSLITLSANTIYPTNYTNVSGSNLFIDTLSTSSIFLNGTSQTISFPSQTITWTNGFSVLFQFQYNTPSSTMTLLSITNTNVYSTSVGFNISITSGNVIQFNIMNPANTSTIICSTTLTQNKIYNIAFIYNNSITTATLYIDGVLIQTTTSITQISSLTSGAYQYIYTGGVNSTLNYFIGVIYYLSFYNKSLSTAQISNFYPISYNNLLTTVSVNTNTDLTTQPFSGYPLLAITPSGLYPQLTNNSMFYPVVDNANSLNYQFIASKSQYYQFQPITLTLSSGITLITQFSWTNTNTQTSTLCTFAQTNSTTPTNYISLQQTGYSNLSLIFNNSAQQYINVATISSGTNYNFAATFNGSTSTIYLNGSNINTVSISQIPANANSAISYNYPYIGCFTSGSNYPTSYFTGNINYLALYNRLLTSSEINNFNTSILNYTQISPQIPLKTSYFYQAITNAPLYLYFDADTLNTYDGLTAGQYIKTWTNLGSEGGTALNAVAGNNATQLTTIQLSQYRSQNNNRYYVQIPGNNYFTIPTLTLNLANTGATFIFVASMPQSLTFQRFLDFSSAYGTYTNDIIICNASTNRLGIAIPTNSPTNTASVLNIDNTLRIYAIRLTQNGTIQFFYNNGTNAGTQLIDTFNYAVQPLTTYTSCFISRSNNPVDVSASLILGELLVYRSALSDASINAIIATMQNRWNLDSASQNTVNTQTGINFNPKTSLAATTTCALWLDAADMTTVINYITSSETISQWTDKSANAYALTANAYTNAPYYKINALNNKPGIVFSGGQALGNTSVGSWSFSSNHTIFIVLSNTQGGSLFAKLTSNALPTVYSAVGQRMYWLGDGLQGNGGYSGLYPTFVGGSQGWCSTSQSLLSYGVNSNGFVLCIKLVSLYSFAFYTNGTQMQLVNNGLNESSDTTGQFWIGNSVTGLGPINYLNGTIHEIIAYNTSLGDNDRILVNNYLMNKWGIVPTATPQITNNGVLSTSSLYNFPTMPFQIQNTGIYGSIGPTTSNLLSAYGTATNYTTGTTGSPPLSFTLNTNYLQSVNGIQSLVAPVSGMYQFIVAGASGGYVSTANAGKGIIIIGNYYVYQGQTLEVLVGQPGKSSYQNASGLGSSGGGGTYVSLNGNLLFVAGGGGGTGWTGTTEIANPSANATLTPYGNVSSNAIPTTISGYNGGFQGYGGVGQNSSSFPYVTANLVGYWDFSTSSSYSGSGSNLYDLSGYGNTITISGTPSFNSTGAISFNPSSTSYGSSSAVLLNLVSGFTLESFVFFTNISNTPVTISYALAAGSSYVLQLITTSGSFQSVGAGLYNGNFSTATGAILLGQWYHLVSVYTNLTYTTCVNYINGVVIANASGTNYTAFPNNPASTQIYLGSDPWITGQYLNGKLAMARIYNSPLTAGQVAQNYQALCFKFSGNPYGLPLSYYAGAGGGYYGSGSGSNYGLSYIAGGTGGGGNITYITAGLVAYWDFSTTASYPGSGTNLYDLSGNNFNLSLTNLGTFTSTGQINAAWTTTTYGATTLTTFAAAISFEMLFYLTTTSGNQWLISCGPGNNYGGTGNWSALVSGGTLQFYAGSGSGPNSSGVIFSSAISAATWYHIIFTCTSISGILYLNGVAQSNGTYNQSTFPLTNTVFQLGNWQSTNGLSGKLAMARIYNIPLTASQVLLNYAAVYNKLQVNPYNLSASPSFIGAYGGGFGGGGLSSISAPGASAPVSAGGGGGGYSGGAAGVLSSIGCTGAGGGSYDINGFNNVATIYTGAIPYNYPYVTTLFQNTVLITATLAPNFITVSSTVNMFVGQTIVTSGTTFGSIATSTTYYIYSIINYNTVIFSAAATPALSSYLTVTTATGTMYGALTPFTTGANVGYNLGAGFVYINIINSSASQLTNYQLQTIQSASLKQEIFYPLDALNQYSRAAACGVYSLRLLSSGYTGPIVQLRRDTDNQILDFYGNYGGVLTSLKGQVVQSWAAGTIAYVVKWYDQSGCANHANQYSSNVQPILNYISGQVDFKFSRYLNLPNGTVPAVNSQYTVVLRHNTLGFGIPVTTNSTAGILNSGTQTITTQSGNANSSFSCTAVSGAYADNWATSIQTASGWYSSNNTVSYVYNLANRYIYTNGISAVTPLASSSHANTTANNAIGASGGQYLNGELYNLSIFNIALLDAERNLMEKMPYGNILSSYTTDPYFNDVTLLLHCDSVNEYTSSTLNANITDTSIYKQKVTNLNITGNMRANPTYNNFIGGESVYFDGTPTNYINITNGITFSVSGANGGIKTGPSNIGGINYYIHTFLSNDTFIITNTSLTVDLLIVAGGGGGGSTNDRTAGGGGAGGFLYFPSSNYSAGLYGVVVGSGGTGGIGFGSNTANGTNGGNSSFGGSLIAYGGGGGAGSNIFAGNNGGSGGGRTHNASSSAGIGISGQGYGGGTIGYDSGNSVSGSFAASGGGGAGAIGGNGTISGGGVGGVGIQNGITGSNIYYAGGGGGGCENTGTAGPVGGVGGLGGGGGGATTLGPNDSVTTASGSNATYYGGGGGGAAGNSAAGNTGNTNTGGNGYQGIVILRYRA